MEKLKSVEELNAQLDAFETAVERSIAEALIKLSKREGVSTFHFVPYDGKVEEYVLAISLDSQQRPVFCNPNGKRGNQQLGQFLRDNAVPHRDLIELLKLILLATSEHLSDGSDTDAGI